MKLAKYEEVSNAAWTFAEATETGCRNIDKKRNELKYEWLRKNCGERKKNSAYIVYRVSRNYGTKKWTDYGFDLETAWIENYRETEKCFMPKTGKCGRISKDAIVGWLSK